MTAEKENQGHAETLWKKMESMSGNMQENVTHLNYILYLADLLRTAPTKAGEGIKEAVADVMCVGRSVDGSMTVVGVSSRLRKKCGAHSVGVPTLSIKHKHFEEEIKKAMYPKLSKLKKDKKDKVKEDTTSTGFRFSAFDDKTGTSRLVNQMQEDGVDAAGKTLARPFETCAEHVVFEKLARGGINPSFIYAVQKKNKTTAMEDFEIKIVKRCENCVMAGGSASKPGGETPRLGSVVTDHPALVDAIVPIVTPQVLLFYRSKINKVGQHTNGSSSTGLGINSGNIRVYESVSSQNKSKFFPFLGPTDDEVLLPPRLKKH